MKKFIFSIALFSFAFFACDKEPNPTKTIDLNEAFTLAINQTAELSTDGMKITLLDITEDSRCPTNVECIWAGRVVAEFKVEKGDESFIRSLTDNPANDAALSTSFEAFGHLVNFVEATPYPDGSTIDKDDYLVKIIIE